MTDKQKLIEELEGLEENVSTVHELVKRAKTKAIKGEEITKEELDMVVERIEKLDIVMRERRDVGH